MCVCVCVGVCVGVGVCVCVCVWYCLGSARLVCTWSLSLDMAMSAR